MQEEITYEKIVEVSGLWCGACARPAAARVTSIILKDGSPDSATRLTVCECGVVLGPDGCKLD